MEALNTIIKLLQDELKEQEKEALFERIEQDPELMELYVEQKNLWVKTGATSVLTNDEKVSDFNAIWRKVSPVKKHITLNVVMKYAAILIMTLMLGGTTGYFINNRLIEDALDSQVYAFSSGSMSTGEIQLPDGSVLQLNSRTKVTYQKNNKTQERLVTLDGEAYFNVVHDDNSPFVIDFAEVKVIDLGTEFNVKAYGDEEVIETTLVEGLVDVVLPNDEVSSLEPGQKAVYSKVSKSVEVEEFSKAYKLAWIKNRFAFKNIPLSEIMEELAVWYDVEIKWENPKYKSEIIHLSINRSTSIESVMEMLKVSVHFDYEVVRKQGELSVVIIK